MDACARLHDDVVVKRTALGHRFDFSSPEASLIIIVHLKLDKVLIEKFVIDLRYDGHRFVHGAIRFIENQLDTV